MILIHICPYYYRDRVSNKEHIYFEYCHKPKNEKECPDGRKTNECKYVSFEMELTDEGRKWIQGL